MTRTSLAAALLALLVTGCTETPDLVRYGVPPAAEASRVSIPHSLVSVREVSLPTYAAGEEISLADGQGTITEYPDSIWADDPVRAVTLRVAQVLGQITRRTVAGDPWPFRDPPDAEVDIRFEDLVAESAGRYVARGRYYVAHADPDRADRSRAFDLAVAFDPAGGFPALAAARADLIAALATEIAENGLR